MQPDANGLIAVGGRVMSPGTAGYPPIGGSGEKFEFIAGG